MRRADSFLAYLLATLMFTGTMVLFVAGMVGLVFASGAYDAVAALWPPKDIVAGAAFAIESRWWASLTGLALTAGAVWLIVAFVLPLAAEPVSRRISPTVGAFLGNRTLEFSTARSSSLRR